jgi:hypothetical protein
MKSIKVEATKKVRPTMFKLGAVASIKLYGWKPLVRR